MNPESEKQQSPKPTLTTAPTATPEPTPTNTPKPTPTNTPTPTPSPTPEAELYLNAYVNGSDEAVAEYATGGCDSVKSVIALYEVSEKQPFLDRIVVAQEVFIDGSGSMKQSIQPGKLYKYKLTYTYVIDGIQYEKYVWSDFLSIIDDYVYDGGIRTFRDLMYFVWYDLFEIDMEVEGFNFSLKSIYLWLLIAGVMAFLIFKKLRG